MSFDKLMIYKEGAKIGALVSLMVLAIAGAVQLTRVPGEFGSALRPALKEATGTLQDTHSSVMTVKNMLVEIKKDYDDNQANMAANSEATTVLIRGLTDTVSDTRVQLFGGKDCHPTAEKTADGWSVLDCKDVAGLFPQTSLLLSNANSWMVQLQSDTHDLNTEAGQVLKSTGLTIEPFQADLVKLGSLEDTLDSELKSGSPHALATVDEFTAVLAHFDSLLTDPNIPALLKNSEEGTDSLKETFKTVDLATRGLRKQAGRVRWVIEQITNFLKGTVKIY